MRNFIMGFIVGVILATGISVWAISIARVEEVAVDCYNSTDQTLRIIGV